MEVIKVLFAAIAGSVVVTTIIVGIARPLASTARRLLVPGQRTSRAYVDSARTATH